MPEGSEPEQLPRPPDDVRPELMQLPPPPLNFGSDKTLGVTDPTRYNTTPSVSRLDVTASIHPDHYSPPETGLPPVRQLLTPGSQSSGSTSPYLLRSPPVAHDFQSHSSLHEGKPTEGSAQSVVEQLASNRHLSTKALPSDHRTCIAVDPDYTETHPQAIPSRAFVSPAVNDGANVGLPRMPLQASHGDSIIQPIVEIASSEQRLNHQFVGPVAVHTNNEHLPLIKPSGLNAAIDGSTLGRKEQKLRASEVKPTPKVVRDDVHPDHGEVWVYEDGSICPKVVEGESVNADWGVTKAGKPRKRLAIACLACREKKIRCLAAKPRCAQCEKSGRVCKYATAYVLFVLFLQLASPTAHLCVCPLFIHQRIKTFAMKIAPPIVLLIAYLRHRYPRIQCSPSYDFQAPPKLLTIKNEPAERSPDLDTKRDPSLQGQVSDVTKPLGRIQSRRQSFNQKRRCSASPDVRTGSKADLILELKREPATTSGESDPIEPFAVDPETASHYLNLFQHYVADRSDGHDPKASHIVQSKIERAVSQPSLMVLYAMLALGTVFAQSSESEVDGRLLSDLARRAMLEADGESGCVTCQTRLLLVSYYLASDQPSEAWDLVTSRLPSASALASLIGQQVKGIG